MFEIKQGTPPVERNKRNKYPFPQMEPNTYFDVPADNPAAQKNKSGAPRIATATYGYARRHNKKFVIRQLENGIVRVYRTE